MYKSGDKVRLKIDKSKIGIVVGVNTIGNGINRYTVFHNAGDMQEYFEDQIEFADVESRAEIIDFYTFIGRYSLVKMSQKSTSSFLALNSGKIKFIPFQFRPLAKIVTAFRPRLLIADEVGVGKTIETGIILKEFEKREDTDRIIIICPKDLTSKWRREMKSRFDESFEILTGERLHYCIKELNSDGVWPYECRKCIVGLEMVRREEIIDELNKIDVPANFDMVIVDEAHHVTNENSLSHEIVKYFCDNSDIAIFLTATPLQLGSADLYNLLNLLEPEEYDSYDTFCEMAEPNANINNAIRYIRNKSDADWQCRASQELQMIRSVNNWAMRAFSGNKTLEYWIQKTLDIDSPMSDAERIDCIRDLEGLHTFFNIINRTKRKDIGEFTIREPIPVLIKFNEAEQAFYDAITEYKFNLFSSAYGERTARFIMPTIERMISSSIPAFVRAFREGGKLGNLSFSSLVDEEILEDGAEFTFDNGTITHILSLADNLPETDCKVERLNDIIEDTINNTEAGKLLIFSFFKNTIQYLYEQIGKTGARVAFITGDTTFEDRDKFRERFRLPKENENALDVLLSSEVGCEGLDYEFCSRMVNYDIPWNPMKIEQRIGRIDRFGQKSPKVQIFNFITGGTVEERIFYRCFERIGVFTNTIGDLEGILGEISNELFDTAFDLSLTEEQQELRMQQLTDNALLMVTEQRVFEENAKHLFLMDLENEDDEITKSQKVQPLLLANAVSLYIKTKFPASRVEFNAGNILTISFNKEDKQLFGNDVAVLKKSRKIDRNSASLALVERFIQSDEKEITIVFTPDDAEKTGAMFVSIDNVFIKLAQNEFKEAKQLFTTSFAVNENDILKKGSYIFGCWEWHEIGFRETTETRVIVINTATNEVKAISLCDFELMFESGRAVDSLADETDITVLENSIIERHRQSKARLIEINEDAVNRKFATVNTYFSRKIKALERSVAKADNAKISKMQESNIAKIKDKWEKSRAELNGKFKSDIIIKLFAYGKIEVE